MHLILINQQSSNQDMENMENYCLLNFLNHEYFQDK